VTTVNRTAFPWRVLDGAVVAANGRVVFAPGEPERRGLDAARLVAVVNDAAARR
jgi:hypothetical protein